MTHSIWSLFCPRKVWGQVVLLAGFVALALGAGPARGDFALGISSGDAAKRNVEFQEYGRMMPLYRENGIRAALLEFSPFVSIEAIEDQLVAMMKQFNVVHFTTTSSGVNAMDAAKQRRAPIVGRALARYVAGGGGLFLDPQAVRYPHTDDEKYWSAVLAPLGLTLLHEGVFDKTRSFQGVTLGPATFFFTHNIVPHPVTEGVSCVYLPENGYSTWPGVVLMQYSPDWQILVRGEKEAQSYHSNDDNVLDLNLPGTVPSAPPVLAVRELGKGRIVSYALADLYTGMNHLNPMWSEIVETNGDPASHQGSDSMKLQMNAYKWLAQPSAGLADYGTYKAVPYQPVQYPGSVDWDRLQFTATEAKTTAYPDGQVQVAEAPSNGIRGIFGVHTSYSDGTGTVADYVKAAQAAGLSFVVFNDPLELLTAAKLDQLKADCAAASTSKFYAVPGIEFSDVNGNRYAMWGPKVIYPAASFKEPKNEYVEWDGKAIHQFGHFEASTCMYSPVALIDYNQLRQNHSHQENLWVVFDVLPFVYDQNKLVANNMPDYLFGLRDLRWLSICSYTRIRSPQEVAGAAATCFTGFRNIAAAHQLDVQGYRAGEYVSQGPVIAAWQEIDAQMESNWRYTRGAQRVRVFFDVRADQGIAEVQVLDADHGAIRRFLGHGAKEFSREFELVDDQQHYLVLQVTDTAGARAAVWRRERAGDGPGGGQREAAD